MFVRYASSFIAMVMGAKLTNEMGIRPIDLDHRNYANAKSLLEQMGEGYFDNAVDKVNIALKHLYGDQIISLQQLSATFRRGDLLELLVKAVHKRNIDIINKTNREIEKLNNLLNN